MLFEDRFQAGRELASKLAEFRNREDTVVLALPRGGVPVGYEVAKAIHAPLDIFVVRKLGVPGQEELAMGALASGGITVLNRDVVERLAISPETIKAASSREEPRRQTGSQHTGPDSHSRGRRVSYRLVHASRRCSAAQEISSTDCSSCARGFSRHLRGV